MPAEAPKSRHKRIWLIGGAVLVAGFVAARMLGRLGRIVDSSEVEQDGEIDDNAPAQLRLHFDERRYPPFYDSESMAVRIEGEYDETGDKQLVVVGIDQKEFDNNLADQTATFALARGDSTGLWHPAVARKSLRYGKAADQRGEAYAFAALIGPSILHILPGVIKSGHFTPYKSTRVLAMTNQEGLLYDYPNVPLVSFADKDS